MRIKDWSSDVCASDLIVEAGLDLQSSEAGPQPDAELVRIGRLEIVVQETKLAAATRRRPREQLVPTRLGQIDRVERHAGARSEEHTSELQSLMRISYAVFCLKQKK